MHCEFPEIFFILCHKSVFAKNIRLLYTFSLRLLQIFFVGNNGARYFLAKNNFTVLLVCGIGLCFRSQNLWNLAFTVRMTLSSRKQQYFAVVRVRSIFHKRMRELRKIQFYTISEPQRKVLFRLLLFTFVIHVFDLALTFNVNADSSENITLSILIFVQIHFFTVFIILIFWLSLGIIWSITLRYCNLRHVSDPWQ